MGRETRSLLDSRMDPCNRPAQQIADVNCVFFLCVCVSVRIVCMYACSRAPCCLFFRLLAEESCQFSKSEKKRLPFLAFTFSVFLPWKQTTLPNASVAAVAYCYFYCYFYCFFATETTVNRTFYYQHLVQSTYDLPVH